MEQIQRTLLDINNWIKSRMKGKSGLIRGGLLRKTTDYSARLVIITDHTLTLGTVGLPWQVVLKLYEPFAINYILKKDSSAIGVIQQFLKSEVPPDVNDLKRLFASLISKPNSISEQLKEYFIHVAEEIVKDKVVIYKRDPVNSRDNWLAGDVRVDKTGVSMSISPFDLPRVGGDEQIVKSPITVML
jgi:DNA-directed RNA polymerase beta' subunit